MKKTNKKALKNYIYRRPLIGSKLVFLGALAMMIWSVWECVIRIDSFDSIFGVTLRFMKEHNLLKEYIEELLRNPESRMELLNPVILALIALFAFIVFLSSRYWKPGFLAIPLAGLIMFFHTSDNMIVRTLNLFETIKYASAASMIAGEGLNIFSALTRTHQYKKQLAARKKARSLPSHGTRKTLIPERRYPEIDM